MPESPASSPRILYCRCAYAQVVPGETKDAVLQRLSESGEPFEAVSDLCEMSASRDPRLQQIADGHGCVRIAACYPRAVRWLFHAAGSPLPEQDAEIVNMRELTAEDAAARLLAPVAAQPLPSNATHYAE